MAKDNHSPTHGTAKGAIRRPLAIVGVLAILGTAAVYAGPTAAAFVLLSILVLVFVLFLLVRFWSDPAPAQEPVPVAPPPAARPTVQTQLKLLLNSHITRVGGQAKGEPVHIAFRVEEPPPGSRLLRYDSRLKDWIAVPWAYDTDTRMVITGEPVGDASIWVLEERRRSPEEPSDASSFSDGRRPALLDRLPDQTP
jgi:hypothetical protein